MTQCIEVRFSFTAHFSHRVVAGFNPGEVSNDWGALLLRQVDRRIHLSGRPAGCFVDGRSPSQVRHEVSGMPAQRIYGLPLGYEDLNVSPSTRFALSAGLPGTTDTTVA
jgi:hypothetical protein